VRCRLGADTPSLPVTNSRQTQTTPVNGSPQWLDVVNVAARASVTVRVRLNYIPGRAVYYCHILDHEDLGMMGVVKATG
jgi:FtsP/CotA-like multicopper oxidase with cupredoxin domain